MPEITKQPVRREIERKPTWTMDVMILSNLNQISQAIDQAAVEVETGNMNALLTWKADLLQFYTNIRSFFTPQIDEVARQSFENLDTKINIANRTMPTNQKDLNDTIGILRNLNMMFYHARNELFMKFIDIISPTRKALEYTYGALSKEEVERRVAKAENKEDMEEAQTDGNEADEPQ